MKRLLTLAVLFALGTAQAADRVAYVEKEVVDYYTDADGKTKVRTVRKLVPTVVPDPETGEAAPTPHAEIVRVLGLLPKPSIGFVDYGCGDARWCIAAAEKWGCRVTGVEIDPTRAASAKERVRRAGLGHLITIIEGDAITTDVQADVGVAYLYSDVLTKLKPRIEKLSAFASYLHQPPGLAAIQDGDTWFYTRPQLVQAVRSVRTANWNGRQYTAPSCNSSRCEMCQSIRYQLSVAAPTTEGHYVKRCSNGVCWYEWVSD